MTDAPAAPIRCRHMNHVNAVVGGFDETVGRLRDLYGIRFLADMPRDEWHACLVSVAGVIFQLFSPHDDLLHARFGPHYVGIEYQVPDVAAARDAVRARGMRVIRELGAAFHVHPADAFGVALEFYDRSFHDDPPMEYLEQIGSAEEWGRHPLGLVGLRRYSVVVADMAAAVRFFEELTGAERLYDEARPAVGAQAVGLALGDTVLELMTPVADGVIGRHLARYGDGIRSSVFQVQDLERARAHFAGLGVELGAGDAQGSLAIAPEDNCGLLFEFSE